MSKTIMGLLMVGGVLCLLFVETCVLGEPEGYWSADGYVRRANAIVLSEAVTLMCAGQVGPDSIRLRQDSIIVKPESLSEAARNWLLSSNLRRDVIAFNNNPTSALSPFVLAEEGCGLSGVNRYYHRIDLPYDRMPRWTGDVRFAVADLRASFRGGRSQRSQYLEVIQPRRVDNTTTLTVDLGQEGEFPPTEDLQLYRAGELVASARYVGGRLDGAKPTLVEGASGVGVELRLNGYGMPTNRGVWLETGDWVHFTQGDDSFTYVVEEGEDRAELISSRRPADAERDYMIPRLQPFVGALAGAFEGALQHADRGEMDSVDIRLTLDRELEGAGQVVVNTYCAQRQLEARPRAVSALVMDAASGAVLAMPSCPGDEELGGYDRLSSRDRNRYRSNQNLALHPVGSALKPFWATSVATAFPRLLDLELSAHGDIVNDVFRCPVGSYGSRPQGQRHGIERFIETSCNRFMVEMGTVALMAKASRNEELCGRENADMAECLGQYVADTAPADSEGVRFCDQVVHLVLRDSLPFTRNSCGLVRRIDQHFPRAPLDGLTRARTASALSPVISETSDVDGAYHLDRYRVDVWDDLITPLRLRDSDRMTARLGFRDVSPQIAHLALDAMETLRGNWVSLLLGGESSRWSNFQLAEAMSRLMTGRDVRGRLVLEPAAGADPDSAATLPREVLHRGARRRVLHAMELVTRQGGTASNLGPTLEALRNTVRTRPGLEEYEGYGFAKTGTPDVVVEREEREGSVLVMGVLVVPRKAGPEASRRHNEVWFSNCPDQQLRNGVLGVPPVDLLGDVLENGEGVGVTMAVYLDDLDPDGDEPSARDVAFDLMEPLGAYLAERLERQLGR